MFQKTSFVLIAASFSIGLAFGCGEGGTGGGKSPPVGSFASRATTPNVVTFGSSITPTPVGAPVAPQAFGFTQRQAGSVTFGTSVTPTPVGAARTAGESSTQPGGSSSGGLGSLTACSTGSRSSTSKCSESERVAWGNCLISACSDVYKRCFGDGYAQGSFGGPCGTWVGCSAACSCGDDTCQARCGAPDKSCNACTKDVVSCVAGAGVRACPVPDCIDLDGEEDDLPDEPVSKPPARSTTPPGAAGACAALATCCDQLVSASDKETCKKNLELLRAGGDAACNGPLDIYRKAKKCS